MPSESRLRRIAQFLARPIPGPVGRKARAASSWRKLKPGQLLQLKEGARVYTPEITTVPPGGTFLVLSTNSEGAELTPCHPWGERRPGFGTLRWTLPNWERTFTRFRKTRKPAGGPR